ncbi:hypothetical protein BH11PSE3_BH11PSE3_41720 [soil metagenome]
MQVTCPNCDARYAVDPLAIGPIGRTVQCVRCSHRWREKAAAVAPEPPSVPLRPRADSTPDSMSRAPDYRSGLPAVRPPPPKSTWGGWLSATIVVVILLGITAYFLRNDIRGTLPAEWQTAFNLDAVRGLLKK